MYSDAWAVAGTIVTAVFTGVLAVFAWLVWRLNVRQHRLAHEARLEMVGAEAVFDPTSREIRVELLLWNPSEAPAVIQDWEVLVKDLATKYSQSIGAGRLVKTEVFKVKTLSAGRDGPFNDQRRPHLPWSRPSSASSGTTVSLRPSYCTSVGVEEKLLGSRPACQ